MKKILIATKNPGKLGEFRKFLHELPLEVCSLEDVGIEDDVSEEGQTYQENSQRKALFYAKKSGLPVISDDGGLEIAALNNEPGVRSRRWLGHEASDQELIEHLINVSKNLPKDNKTAYFRTVVSFGLPEGKVYSEFGEVKGEIRQPKLKHLEGYPFRSFFYLPKIGKYYHESDLTDSEEKKYNHRYIAINKLIPIIKKQLDLA